MTSTEDTPHTASHVIAGDDLLECQLGDDEAEDIAVKKELKQF